MMINKIQDKIQHLGLFLLLLLPIGNTGAWAQTFTPGKYFIASMSSQADTYGTAYTYNSSTPASNYYMCPTDSWYYYTSSSPYYTSSSNGQPFLTTYKCRNGEYDDFTKAIWVIEEQDSYYTIRTLDGKYLTYNEAMGDGCNLGRMRVHLEDSPAEDDALFNITWVKGKKSYDITTKRADANTTRKYLNVNQGNQPSLGGVPVKDKNGKDKNDGPSGVTNKYVGGILGLWIEGSTTDVNCMWNIEPAVVAEPTIVNNNDGTFTVTAEEGADVYYTTDGTPPTIGSTQYVSGIDLEDNTISTVNVFASKEVTLPSEVVTKTIVYKPVITLDAGSFTYDGTAKVPAISSVVAAGTPLSATEYDVEYKNNTNAGTATVVITNKSSSEYLIYGSVDFTIAKATFTPVVSIEGWEYGMSANTPSVSENPGEGEVTYSYTVKDAGAYSSTAPSDVGDYTVKAVIGATTNYEGAEVTANFTISPRSIGDGTKPADGFDISITETPSVTVSVNDGSRDLVLDTDYTWKQDEVNTDIIIITGIGNYDGEARVINAYVTFRSPEAISPYWAAYNSMIDATPPPGMTAYVVRKVNVTAGTVSVTRVNYIPKDVPVILEASTELSSFVASPIGGETTPISADILSSNQLRVAPASGVEVESREAYMFYLGEFVLTQAGTIREGNIFLYNPNYAAPGAQSSRRYLQIVKEDEETGIKELRWTKDNEVYDLSGRRLNLQSSSSKGQLPKGVYIVNGQKIYVK